MAEDPVALRPGEGQQEHSRLAPRREMFSSWQNVERWGHSLNLLQEPGRIRFQCLHTVDPCVVESENDYTEEFF